MNTPHKTLKAIEEHTPGPWTISEPNQFLICADSTAFGRPNSYPIPIATVWEPGLEPMTKGQEHANARLIAAAPELLAALQQARSYIQELLDLPDADSLHDLLVNSGEQVEQDLAAAIAKATKGTA